MAMQPKGRLLVPRLGRGRDAVSSSCQLLVFYEHFKKTQLFATEFKIWCQNSFEILKSGGCLNHLSDRIADASIVGASNNSKIYIFPNAADEKHQVLFLLFAVAAIDCNHTRRLAALRPA